jgi:hypothetical protein
VCHAKQFNMKDVPVRRRRLEVILHAFLTLLVDRGKQSTLCPGRFTSGEKFPSTLRRGRMVGLKFGSKA